MTDKLYQFIGKHPFWVILVCLTIAIMAASGAQKLVFKTDYRIFFGEDNPQLVAFESMQNVYNKSFITKVLKKSIFFLSCDAEMSSHHDWLYSGKN